MIKDMIRFQVHFVCLSQTKMLFFGFVIEWLFCLSNIKEQVCLHVHETRLFAH